MTAATITPDCRPEPRGLDRLIERLGTSLVRWSHDRAELTQPSHERQLLLVQQAAELRRREHEAARAMPHVLR